MTRIKLDDKAFHERFPGAEKMLFECDGRSAKFEIGNGAKEGEYSLTFLLQLSPRSLSPT